MKNPNSFGVHFIIRRSRGNGKSAPVYARITVNRVSREVSMNQHVDIDKWNGRKGMAKPNSPEMRELNVTLETERSKITSIYNELGREGAYLNADAVKNRYLGIDSGATIFTMSILKQEYEADQKPELKHGTWKNYKTTYSYLERYMKECTQAGDIRVSQVDNEFLSGLKRYIREHPTPNRAPATQNGLAKHLERVKRMINWAQINGKLAINKVEKYPTPKKKHNRKYISELELDDLETCKLSTPELDFVRDLFIFSCYTGVAYGDLMILKPIDLTISKDQLHWISNQRIKSDGAFLVPLLERPLDILRKYRENEAAIMRDGLFPYISNAKLNTLLKVIGTARGYGHPLRFHDARHIFATYITLAKDVPIESVSKMMGHTKISTTQLYAKIVAAKVKRDMEMLQVRMGVSETKAEASLRTSENKVDAESEKLISGNIASSGNSTFKITYVENRK